MPPLLQRCRVCQRGFPPSQVALGSQVQWHAHSGADVSCKEQALFWRTWKLLDMWVRRGCNAEVDEDVCLLEVSQDCDSANILAAYGSSPVTSSRMPRKAAANVELQPSLNAECSDVRKAAKSPERQHNDAHRDAQERRLAGADSGGNARQPVSSAAFREPANEVSHYLRLPCHSNLHLECGGGWVQAWEQSGHACSPDC